jgi:hypothetical protein
MIKEKMMHHTNNEDENENNNDGDRDDGTSS